MGSPTKACPCLTRDSFRLPPSSRPQTLNTSNTMAKGSGSKKAKKSGSNVFALFSQRQIQEFKEAFGIMGADKDGLLSSSDIVAAFNSVGKSVSEVDNAFGEFVIEDGMIDAVHLKGLMVSKKDE